MLFRAQNGQTATTDNILQWSPKEPHALEISIDIEKTGLAYPVSNSDK